MPRRWDGAAVGSAAVTTTSSDCDCDCGSDYDSDSDCDFDFDSCDWPSADVGPAFGGAQLEACNRKGGSYTVINLSCLILNRSLSLISELVCVAIYLRNRSSVVVVVVVVAVVVFFFGCCCFCCCAWLTHLLYWCHQHCLWQLHRLQWQLPQRHHHRRLQH